MNNSVKLKKKDGSIQKFGIPLISLVAIFIVIMVFIVTNASLEKKDKVDIIVRDYLLSMETEGYLIPTDEEQLVNELKDLGVKNINLTGTTLSNVGYGNKITLSVSGDLEVKEYSLNNLFSVNKRVSTLSINILKSSIAKH
ncbi:hypothetical protein [Clostridium paridis]|uniref:DUF4320 family protein n=1 Tax=Clostridium paridis TaxID=2803863 RepID=A0A937FEC4_9CLOT|nr:hypothetical protein [Clostridium paridis]MBL4932274.1 hypothetical protein [Clostridium paridis]